MSPMVEKIARSMAGTAWGDLDPPRQTYWVQRAIAALEAIRSPTDDMCGYAKHRHPEISREQARDIWFSMVDNALYGE